MQVFSTEDLHRAPVLEALKDHRVFQLRVSEDLANLNQLFFEAFGEFVALAEDDPLKVGQRIDASCGSLTGYHPMNGLGGNNTHRTGIIVERTDSFSLADNCDGRDSGVLLTTWRSAHWALAHLVLERLAVQLRIDNSHFREEFDPCPNSQFHVKAYDTDTESAPQRGNDAEFGSGGLVVKLSPHVDPSVITILVHAGDLADGLQGLQFENTNRCGAERSQQFVDVPGALSGYGIATVVAGQLLEPLTGGMLRGARHRVALKHEDARKPRMVATFFFQPQFDALLSPLPSPLIKACRHPRRDQTFAEWKQLKYGVYFSRPAGAPAHAENTTGAPAANAKNDHKRD
eukprot:TRINITY_DN38216_c0_g1_i1.p1 TRINITY_DN38216_c0_g1~~TRINITY_DN38216_c0_g1_i1.p1  ORF type:complete len:345 (+),score=44.59 TRINITY_DN38216_c0_g1_i1:143-1177(+)